MKTLASLAALAVLTGGASAADLYVPSQYSTIQSAINAAHNGDTIHVAAGTYHERGIAWNNKSLTLRGAGQGQSIVDGGGYTQVGQPGCFYLYNVPANARIDGLTVRSGFADYGKRGGLNLSSSSPTVSNCTFSGCVANDGVGGGAISCDSGSPTIADCTFTMNEATDGYGGAIYNQTGSPTITNCSFVGNFADDEGSGIGSGGGMNTDGGNPILTNCVFTANWCSQQGGGFRSSGGSPSLVGCTLTGNIAGWGQGGGTRGNCVMTNSILWGNNGTQMWDGGTVTYSDIQGGMSGTGNINADPLFVNPTAGNFRLLRNSPCINTGSNGAVTVSTDLDGNARIRFGIVDMGAYESLVNRIHIPPTPISHH